jgi:hypothetical protein
MARVLAVAALVLGILAALAQIASFIRDVWRDTRPEIAMQEPKGPERACPPDSNALAEILCNDKRDGKDPLGR